ncbi:MAG: hypothetical protein Aureis2KO_22150 [Aureisphaera sp.]
MNKFLWALLVVATFFACKDTSTNSDTKGESADETKTEEKELSTAETIAYKSGFEHWKNVNEVSFTFNVDRGERHFERSFIWFTKTDEVIYMNGQDSIAYKRGTALDSLQTKADQAFINDKYWLLPQFQLIWDEGTSFSEKENQVAPLSKDTLDMLTITYGSEGGYTPGDAYDFYFGKDFMIREWVFREGNQAKPSMINSFEDYEDFNGLKIAKTHRDSTGNFKLHFTNIEVK